MSTIIARSRSVKPSTRSLRISDPINGVRALVITRDGERCGYMLKEIPVDFGRGFRLDKYAEGQGSDPAERGYDVHLDEQLGDSCTCKGHTYKGHCKHVDAVKFLISRGTL